jgi:hypothetical protein
MAPARTGLPISLRSRQSWESYGLQMQDRLGVTSLAGLRQVPAARLAGEILARYPGLPRWESFAERGRVMFIGERTEMRPQPPRSA